MFRHQHRHGLRAGHGDRHDHRLRQRVRQRRSLPDNEATIRKNGQVVAQSALKVGEIAHVKGLGNVSDGTVMPTAWMLRRTS